MDGLRVLRHIFIPIVEIVVSLYALLNLSHMHSSLILLLFFYNLLHRFVVVIVCVVQVLLFFWKLLDRLVWKKVCLWTLETAGRYARNLVSLRNRRKHTLLGITDGAGIARLVNEL
jgi:hypothetical protein